MRFDKERWNAMLPYEKLFAVAGFVCFIAFVVFAVLELLDRFGILLIGVDPTAIVVSLMFAWQACEVAVNWRTNHETAQYTLFCFAFLGGLFAIVAIISLFVNL